MAEIDNPAGRLLNIFRLTRGINSQTTGYEGWSKVFGIDCSRNVPSLNDQYKLVGHLQELRELVTTAQEAISSIEELNNPLYLSPFSNLQVAVPEIYQLGHQFGSIAFKVTDIDLTRLEFAAHELSKRHPEPLVDEKTLESLVADINALFDEVKASLLPEELKKLILSQLSSILLAIQEYRIGGIERLQEVLPSIVGTLYIVQNFSEKPSNKETASTLSRVKKILTGFVSAVTFVSKAQPLIGPVTTVIRLLLPANSNDIPPVDIPPQ